MKLDLGLSIPGIAVRRYGIQSTTWDPVLTDSNITLSNGNKTATAVGSGWKSSIATGSQKFGKRYWRTKLTGTTFMLAGLANASAALSNYIGSEINGIGAYVPPNSPGTNGAIQLNGGIVGAFPILITSGDFLVIAYDQPSALFYATTMTASGVLNPNWNLTSANPASGTGGMDMSVITGSKVPATSILSSGDMTTLDTVTVISDPTLVGFSPYDS